LPLRALVVVVPTDVALVCVPAVDVELVSSLVPVAVGVVDGVTVPVDVAVLLPVPVPVPVSAGVPVAVPLSLPVPVVVVEGLPVDVAIGVPDVVVVAPACWVEAGEPVLVTVPGAEVELPAVVLSLSGTPVGAALVG
jgi:hypothetical protein